MLLWIALGGALGAVARYLLSGWVTASLFTTFSTFSFETVALLQEGAWLRASTYVLGSVFLGIAGVLAGISLASTIIQLRA